MIRLVLKDSEGGEASCPVLSDITIGRSAECQIRLNNPGVSRKHAKIYSANDQFFIEDLGTPNGTRVNGDQIEKATRIQHGDLIQVAGEKIRVLDLPVSAGSAKDDTTLTHNQEVLRDKTDETKDPVKKAWMGPIEPRAALLKTEKMNVDPAEAEEIQKKAEKKRKMVFAFSFCGAALLIGLLLWILVKT